VWAIRSGGGYAIARTVRVTMSEDMFMTDLLPALKGQGSPPLCGRFIGSPHLFGFTFVFGGQ
jgi:hypothetical protein